MAIKSLKAGENVVSHLKYVLITAARNEEALIEKTIRSVVNQSVLPEKWVIVSDGSTDRTDEIVKKYVKTHQWIELLRISGQRGRHFAAKVGAFNAGYDRMKSIKYDYIGSLDADISFDSDYFKFLLEKLSADSKLGVVGTPFVEGNSHYDYRFTNIEHVSGACQLFRRECFEAVGGYISIKGGGEDWTAVTTARMKGWKTRTFTEKTCLHHRKMSSVGGGWYKSWFKHGGKDYYLGGHPLWQIFRSVYQMRRKPYIFGGVFLLFGYIWAWASRVERPVSQELIEFNRREQMQRLKNKFKKAFTGA
jgi:glycosyltransferase involved in cell wall biosynthesis